MALTFAAPQKVEVKAIDFASNCYSKGKAYQLGLGLEINSALKPFYLEISLKVGGKRTSECLDVRSVWTSNSTSFDLVLQVFINNCWLNCGSFST